MFGPQRKNNTSAKPASRKFYRGVSVYDGFQIRAVGRIAEPKRRTKRCAKRQNSSGRTEKKRVSPKHHPARRVRRVRPDLKHRAGVVGRADQSASVSNEPQHLLGGGIVTRRDPQIHIAICRRA